VGSSITLRKKETVVKHCKIKLRENTMDFDGGKTIILLLELKEKMDLCDSITANSIIFNTNISPEHGMA